MLLLHRLSFPVILALFLKLAVGSLSLRHDGRYTNENWDAAFGKADSFVAQLNLTEKIRLVTGATGPCIGNIAPIERQGFPGLCLVDGPTSLNRADSVTVFPAGLTVAATWDRSLIYRRGLALGEEFKAKGAHVALGPTAGPLGRHPLGGRNWEGFSPDPFLTGVAMGMTVRGMQKNGVQTCSKHYIGNEQETQRSNTTLPDGTVINAVSSNIDDRTLHELYLWPFADAVRAGTTSMMCSYQRMNQTYTCENTAVLRDLLRDELGFKGYVVSDWFATHSTSKAANNGLDLEMPGQLDVSVGPYYFGDKLEQAIANESTPVARLDEMARRVLAPYYLLGQDSGYPSVDPSTLPLLPIHSIGRQAARQIGFGFPETPSRNVRSDHPDLVREIGAAGTVLLKNIDNALPLKIPKDIGVFGNDAADLSDGLVILPGGIEGSDIDYRGFDIGTLDIGGGSCTARHTDVIPPLEAIKSRARADGSRVQYILNNEIIAEGGFKSI